MVCYGSLSLSCKREHEHLQTDFLFVMYISVLFYSLAVYLQCLSIFTHTDAHTGYWHITKLYCSILPAFKIKSPSKKIHLFIHTFIRTPRNHDTLTYVLYSFLSSHLLGFLALFKAVSISTQVSMSTVCSSGPLLIHMSIESVCRTPTKDLKAKGHQNLLLLPIWTFDSSKTNNP